MDLPDTFASVVVYATPLNLFVAFVLYYIISSIAAWHPLRNFPGHPLARFSYLWVMSNSRTGKPNETFTKLNREHGNLVRISPIDLVTDDPDIIRHMNGARTTYSRSSWYDGIKFVPGKDTMLSIRDTAAHDKLKAQVAAGYAGRENNDLEEGINSQIAGIVDLIRRKYISRGGDVKPMDLGKVAQYFTLDVITRLGFGRQFGYLATDSDLHDYISTTEAAFPLYQILSEVPFLCSIFFSKTAMKLYGPKPTDKAGVGKLLGLAQEVVSKRYGPDAKDERDMLGAFVRHGLTQSEAEQEVLLQISAGSDTTATAIRTTFLYIMTTPHVYYALKKEIASAIGQGRVSSPISLEEAKQLPYLQAVIYEGLRMKSPFTGHCSKEVPAGGDTIDGRYIPAGTRIVQNFWGILRRYDVFGQDADVFRPERWIEADEATKDKMLRTTELTFGHGRWGCAGKNIAFLELNKIFFEAS
ncbi:Cytochrome P450 monooxygenase lolP1 [Colletotrichum orbiculare MAFF 240422]|uniref:Cytochrome P450 monooxygenase lolP1 n=1 Tax=Colletotrichum orbiculare (strain 104-T / ATCC 96160 / CBS 514.97 / LARS 414 / MAFF 240422) TaxID=1213857 RepID=N4VJ59_COLOR|nr:Cytochrome P450 monooxygenase lolP1 [Colletotrichum orbiculare MAFF 240422]